MGRRADQRRRHQSEERQRREASADVGRVDERVAIPACGGQLLERGAGIRDGDELPARLVAAGGGQPLPEEALHRRDFDRAAALAGDDDPGAFGVHPGGGLRDRALVGRVEHEQLRGAGRHAVNRPQHFGAEAAAAHAEQIDLADALFTRRVAERREAIEVRAHGRGDVEPAEPRRDGFGGRRAGLGIPHRHVPMPDARDDVFVQQLVGELGGRFERKGHSRVGSPVRRTLSERPGLPPT